MGNWSGKNVVTWILTTMKNKLDLKVDKVSGKGLSTNDYTTEEKQKLAGIAEGANKYTHPAHTARTSGLYKITVDNQGHVTEVTAVSKTDITNLGIPGSNTTYSNMTGASSSAAGKAGLVPAPAAGDQNKVLKGDGTWAEQSNYTHPAYTPRASGLYKITVDATGHVSSVTAVAKSDITGLGIPAQDTTYSDMKGASSSAAGTHGLVPAPAAGAATRYLRSDGTWATPPDTNTTYSPATQSANGLMSAADKTKLDGFGAASTYALKADITGTYKYKGSVASASKLPTSGQTVGDVYDIQTASTYGGAGMNVAWNGTKWDPLGEIFQIEEITEEEFQSIVNTVFAA